MPKARMVTRTITTTKVSVLGYPKLAQELVNIDAELNGVYDNSDAAMQAFKKTLTVDDDFTPVEITILETCEKLYGMLESVFIDAAKELPVRKKKEEEEN